MDRYRTRLFDAMSKFLHRRKNGRRRGDIEAHPTSGSRSGEPPLETLNLGEYPALDRYISTYREDGGHGIEEGVGEKGVPPKWWQIWKGRGEEAQRARRAAEVPETWLTTEITTGISQSTADDRRKYVGWNELTTEKTNILYKLVTYFMGPILYGGSKVPLSLTRMRLISPQ